MKTCLVHIVLRNKENKHSHLHDAVPISTNFIKSYLTKNHSYYREKLTKDFNEGISNVDVSEYDVYVVGIDEIL